MALQVVVKYYHKMFSKLFELDRSQARRFARLTFNQQTIAVEGIIEHLRASKHNRSNPDIHAIKEIIDGAQEEQRVFDRTSNDETIL
jgi:hypothetical protein